MNCSGAFAAGILVGMFWGGIIGVGLGMAIEDRWDFLKFWDRRRR